MPANVNKHVARFHRFLPFSSAHDQIYEEYQKGDDDLDLETVAITYAANAIRNGARCVILTGDAGHGKTHLCRRLLQDSLLGYENKEARNHLLNSCDGTKVIPPNSGVDAPSLRIHKDLSEMQPPSKAAMYLEEVGGKEGEALLVCANEGRLRAIISSQGAGKISAEIGRLFNDSFQSGSTASSDGSVHIINLNYQSISAKDTHKAGSLLRRVLKSWVVNGQRWGGGSGCSTCTYEKKCPIRRNRTLLADEGAKSESRIRRLEELFEAVERLGYVVTIREMLMLVAYLITGGMTCSDVDKRLKGANQQIGWQHSWTFYNLLFECPPGLPSDRAEKGMPILTMLKKIDPGSIAIRNVDECILNTGEVFEENLIELQFLANSNGKQIAVDASFGIDDLNANPQNRAELQREAETVYRAVSTLRRRAFFDDVGSGGTVLRRLGFRNGDIFLQLLAGNIQANELVKIKNLLIAGLHSVQGLRLGKTETMLYLVDPAFGKASADAAIIARKIQSSLVSLEPAGRAWSERSKSNFLMPNSVDWLDRTVILKITESDGVINSLPLDLLTFECITRAANGYVSESFYANEIRRIRTFLGQLAEHSREDQMQITIFTRDQLQNVSLDMNVIQVGGE
jgi:hypothetical protein